MNEDKKILCLLSLFAFMACSDGDEIITDNETPYTKQSSSELIQLIEDNIASGEALQEEWGVYSSEFENEAFGVLKHYGIEAVRYIYYDYGELSANTGESGIFTGMKLVWNKERTDFDTTIDAAGFKEIWKPSSVTDDSVNDLHLIMTFDYSRGKSLSTECYKAGKLYFKQIRVFDAEGKTLISEFPPYVYTMKTGDGDQMETSLKKEDGRSVLLSMMPKKGDMKIKIEYNNIRLLWTIYQYSTINALEEMIDGTSQERRNELALELLKKNARQCVVVFTDRDEKIGEWSLIDHLNWKCVFQGKNVCSLSTCHLPFNIGFY